MSVEELPLEVFKKIALDMDYETIVIIAGTNKKLAQVLKDDFFWIDKINKDFGVSPSPNEENLPELYLKLAIHHNIPLPQGLKYAISYRNIARIIFYGTSQGMSTRLFQNKLSLFPDSFNIQQYVHQLQNIAMVIWASNHKNYQLLESLYKEQDKYFLTGLYLTGDMKNLTKYKNRYSDYQIEEAHDLAVTISGKGKIISGSSDAILVFAVLFDNWEVLDTCYLYYPVRLRRELLNIIAAVGTITTLNFWVDNIKLPIYEDTILEAIKYSNIEFLQAGKILGIPISSEFLYTALKYSNREVLEQLIQLFPHDINPSDLLYQAIVNNNYQLTDFLIELGANPERGLMAATKINNPYLVEEFIHRGAKNYNEVLLMAANNDSEEVIQLLIDAGASNIGDALEEAIHYESLKSIPILLSYYNADLNSIMIRLFDQPFNKLYEILKLLISRGGNDFNTALIKFISYPYITYLSHYSISSIISLLIQPYINYPPVPIPGATNAMEAVVKLINIAKDTYNETYMVMLRQILKTQRRQYGKDSIDYDLLGKITLTGKGYGVYHILEILEDSKNSPV